MKILKNIAVFSLCFLIVFMTVIPCFAIEGTFDDTHYVVADKQTFISTFESYLFQRVNGNLVDIPETRLSALRERVSMYPDEIQIVTKDRIFCFGNDTYKAELSFYNSKGEYDTSTIGCYYFDFPQGANIHTSYFSTANPNDNSYSVKSWLEYLSCTNSSDIASYINNETDFSFKKFGNHTADWQVLYYDGNILKAILDYYDYLRGNYQQFYDVTNVGDNFLLFYDCLDSYKGKYNYEFFENDRFKNYLNSSVTFSDDVFYTSNVDTVETKSYQHKERLTFYVKINSEDNYSLSYDLNAQDGAGDGKGMSEEDIQNWIKSYLNTHTTCKHYENGSVSFISWYSHIRDFWFNGTAKFSLHKIATGNHSNVATEWQYYIKFYMPNSYTYAEGENTLFIGSRTVSNAVLFNPSTGKISAGGGGVGSRLDEADLGTMKSKSELLENGWKNGYPNTSGSYPYYIKMTCNGEEFLYFYFKEKPEVHSYFYTDNQIKYTVDMNNAVGYIYQPQYNISNQFDFSTAKITELNKTNISLEQIANAVSVGTDVTSLVTSANVGIVSFFFDIFKIWQSYEIDVLQSALNLNIVLWTNYTGTLANGLGNIRGYYCQFNWNVDGDRSFIRDNSDDNHDYSADIIHDIPTTQEMPTEVVTDTSGNIVNSYNNYTYNYYYTDNNGYVHGGGDDTYVATEPPDNNIQLPSNFDNYNFFSQLIQGSKTFSGFMQQALSFMPAWYWAIVGGGLILIVLCRVLGR